MAQIKNIAAVVLLLLGLFQVMSQPLLASAQAQVFTCDLSNTEPSPSSQDEKTTLSDINIPPALKCPGIASGLVVSIYCPSPKTCTPGVFVPWRPPHL